MDFRPESTRNLNGNRGSHEQQNSMRDTHMYSLHGNGFKPPMYGISDRDGGRTSEGRTSEGNKPSNYYIFGTDTRIPMNNNVVTEAPTNLYDRHNIVNFSDRMSIDTRNRSNLQNKGTTNEYMQKYKQVQHPCQTNIVADDFLRPQNSKVAPTTYFNRDIHVDNNFTSTFNGNGMANMPPPEEMNKIPKKKNDLYIDGKYIGNDPNVKRFSVIYKNNFTPL